MGKQNHTPTAKKHKPLTISVEAEMTYDPERTSNRLHLTISDTTITAKQGEEELGRILGCIGGAVEIRDKRSGCSYTIRPQDLWVAYETATAKVKGGE